MPFEVVSGVSRGMGVLDGDGDGRMGRDSSEVNMGHPIVTNGILCSRGVAMRLFPNYFVISCRRYVALVVVLCCPASSSSSATVTALRGEPVKCTCLIFGEY